MWIVRLALRRPYTFVVAAMLVMILGVVTIFRTPTDIFPHVDIPVIAVVFNYAGMSSDDVESRIVTPFERFMVTTVNDIDHASHSRAAFRPGQLAKPGRFFLTMNIDDI